MLFPKRHGFLAPGFFENVLCCSNEFWCWDACYGLTDILGKVENLFMLLGSYVYMLSRAHFWGDIRYQP